MESLFALNACVRDPVSTDVITCALSSADDCDVCNYNYVANA